MVIVMDMEAGRHIEDEFGAFEEEVLNAQWLPEALQQELHVQKRAPATVSHARHGLDADAFLRNIYLSQE